MNEIVIGIDIGGTNTVFGAVTSTGECLAKDSIRTDSYPEVDGFVRDLCSGIRKLMAEKCSGKRLKRIGVGAPNGNYFNGTIEYAPNLKWKGIIKLADMISAEMCVPVKLTNDANAAALGEMIYGGAKGMKNFILITLGTGLGSGFVVNGCLMYGNDGFAGEVGHIIAIPGGRLCGCGRKGCLETYCSATGIKTTVLEILANINEKSILRDLSEIELTSKEIYNAAKKGDSIALRAFDDTCRLLGEKLADVVAITSPEAVFLFGGLAQAKEFIFEPVKKYMEASMLQTFKNKVRILPSQLPENDAAILGAAAVAES